MCGDFQPDLNSAVYMEWLLAYADLMKIVFQFCEKLVLNLTREKNLGASSVSQGGGTSGVSGGIIFGCVRPHFPFLSL